MLFWFVGLIAAFKMPLYSTSTSHAAATVIAAFRKDHIAEFAAADNLNGFVTGDTCIFHMDEQVDKKEFLIQF